MEVTLADSVLMTNDQGLLVIHLPSLYKVSMVTAAGLSCAQLDALLHSAGVEYALEDRGTVFSCLTLHVLVFFNKLHICCRKPVSVTQIKRLSRPMKTDT